MTYLYRAEQKLNGHMLYRWNPRRGYQFWDVVDAAWLDSPQFRGRPRSDVPRAAVVVDYQDTWAEPELP